MEVWIGLGMAVGTRVGVKMGVCVGSGTLLGIRAVPETGTVGDARDVGAVRALVGRGIVAEA